MKPNAVTKSANLYSRWSLPLLIFQADNLDRAEATVLSFNLMGRVIHLPRGEGGADSAHERGFCHRTQCQRFPCQASPWRSQTDPHIRRGQTACQVSVVIRHAV